MFGLQPLPPSLHTLCPIVNTREQSSPSGPRPKTRLLDGLLYSTISEPELTNTVTLFVIINKNDRWAV